MPISVGYLRDLGQSSDLSTARISDEVMLRPVVLVSCRPRLVPKPTDMQGASPCLLALDLRAALFDVAELAKEAGIAIEPGPVRHGIGGALFFYMLQPGAIAFELMGDPRLHDFRSGLEDRRLEGSDVPTTGAVWIESSAQIPLSRMQCPIDLGASFQGNQQKIQECISRLSCSACD